MKKRWLPRPICPKCCSADVSVGEKTGKCNRCGSMQAADRFQTNGIVSGPVQRFSTDEHERKQKFLYED